MFILLIVVILLCLYFVSIDKITTYQAITVIGASVGGYFYYQRNKIFENQLLQKDKQYLSDSQFKNFLEATKMLTDKDATNEAQISALYLLYDVANSHPENLDRIIQVINKQLVPLILCVNDGCKHNKYNRVFIGKKVIRYSRIKREKKIFEYTKNNIITMDDLYNKHYTRTTITQWQYNGNNTEKIIATALYILKRISIKIIQKNDLHIELSNTILFDIDTKFDKNLKFISKEKPTTNLIFLNCNLQSVNFKETKYHTCQFINCDLRESDFSDANLWGSSFINCNLKNVKFDKTECEGIEFKKCDNLLIEQIDKMLFKNKTDNKPYLFISKDIIIEEIKNKYFENLDDYKKFMIKRNK